MLQRSYSVVKIHLFQFINVYAHWVVFGHLGYFREKYLLLNYIFCKCKQNTVNSFNVEWNLSNPTRQGTREMLEYSGFISVNRNTLGPSFFVRCQRMSENSAVELHCNNYSFMFLNIRVITQLPNSEQSYKGKVKTHKYINRQNQSTTGKL